MENVTFLAVPAWMIVIGAIIIGAFISWAIRDRVRIGEIITEIREHLATLRAKIEHIEDFIRRSGD